MKMEKTELLLKRLADIGAALSREPTALALIGLGSERIDRDRLDR